MGKIKLKSLNWQYGKKKCAALGLPKRSSIPVQLLPKHA